MRGTIVGTLLITALATAPLGAQDDARSKRPNIVLVMADDLGFSDLGCYGSEIATPTLDRLAAGGLRFTQFYNCARCCPTRASLLTGLYPHQAGIGHMVAKDLGAPSYQGHLNERCVTIAEALRPHGYRTLMSGKWDVGTRRPHWPVDRGFDRYFGLLQGASDYFTPLEGPRRKSTQVALDGEPYSSFGDRFYMTDALTDYAVQFIAEAAGKANPFFLYLAYTAPHSPLHAWPEDIAKYRGKYTVGWDALRQERHQKMMGLGIVKAEWPLTPRDPNVPPWPSVEDKDLLDLKMAVYAAQIERMDQGIGKVLAKVREIGAEENTLVMFLSDNGADADEERGTTTKGLPPGVKASSHIYGSGWANVSNTPFRLYKHWAHEGGITTPLVAYWPAVVRKNGITHEPGHVIDLMATCLDAAGVEYPKTCQGREIIPLEGKSLVPIFKTGQREGHEALYWEHEGNRAIRQDKWKLVARYQGAWELYDLEADRTELKDLASRHPEKVKELAAKYVGWAQRCGVLPWEKLR